MKIAINAISVKEGGGIVALEKLLTQFIRLKPEYEYHVIASQAFPDLNCLRHNSVRRYQFPWAERSLPMMGLWYMAVLPAWLRMKHVDVLFSQTCYLPLIGGNRTALLVQDARYFYEAPVWFEQQSMLARMTFKLRRFWVHRSVVAADEVAVQTQALAGLIRERVPSTNGRIRVIPHGPGYLDTPRPRRAAGTRHNGTLELVYVALYRDYKNFMTLFRALKLLREAGIPARLHLTLDREIPAVKALEEQMQEIGVRDWIINHGQLERAAVTDLYENSDVFIFPSICESFGFPQVEAMAFGLPIVAADTAVNREVCGDAAVYFPSDSAKALAALVERFYGHPEELAMASHLSVRRAARFDWAKAAAETLGWMTNGNYRNGDLKAAAIASGSQN
jgi:glycosyltransferase involved in cell wall biosynthesis